VLIADDHAIVRHADLGTISSKLHVESRTQAILYAVKKGSGYR